MREGYKKTEVGVIPEDWEVKSINQLIKEGVISDVMDGNHGAIHPKSSDYVEKGVPFIMANNLKNGKLDIKNCNFISKETSSRLKKGFAKEGDLLITHKGTLGLTAIVPKLNTEYIVLTPQVTYYRIEGNNILKNEYLKYFFDTTLYQNILKKLGAQSTRDYVGITEQKKLNVIVPPLKEQEKIAEILSTIDYQIDDTEKLIEKSKDLKKGLMQKLLAKGIGHSDFKKTEVGEIPVEWEVKKLKDLVEVVNGGTPDTNNDSYWNNGNIKWATPTDITKNMSKYINKTEKLITKNGLKNSSARILPVGSILMSSRATIGERAINTVPMSTNQGFKSLICKGEINNEYLYYYIDLLKSKMIKLASGSTFLEISKKEVENMKIPVPSLYEQIKIAQILSGIDNNIEIYETKKQKLEKVKKGLMQQLLTGKIRVTI